MRHLLREQARAHRGYLIWTATLLTLAVALAALSTLVAAQQRAIARHADAVYGLAGEVHVGGFVAEAAAADGALDPSTTRTAIEGALDAADAAGIDAAARTLLESLDIAVEPDDPWYWADTADTAAPSLGVAAVDGSVDWDALLVSGHRPAHGEIVVSATWAEATGLGLGDHVFVRAFEYDPSGGTPVEVLESRAVTGLIQGSATGLYTVAGHSALVPWEDAFELAQDASALTRLDDGTALWGGEMFVELGAAELTPEIAALGLAETESWWGDPSGHTLTLPVAIAAAALTLGMVAMALAAGRSQAAARSTWVATARVLGSRRRSIVAATVLEVTLVGLGAGLLGALLGYAAHAGTYAWFESGHPTALLPSAAVLPAWAVGGAVAMGVVIAAIVGAVPAFWSARVAPVEALKRSTPLDDAEVSRTVSVLWVVVPWLVAGTALFLLRDGVDDGLDALRIALGIVVIVLSVAVIAGTARGIVRGTAAVLAGRRAPWALAAGDTLVARIRMAAVPAAVMMGWGIVAGLWITGSALDRATGSLADPLALSMGPTVAARTAAVGFVVLTIAALATFMVGSRGAAEEDDARRALGLTPTASRVSAAVRFALPLAVASLTGIMGGSAVQALFYAAQVDGLGDDGLGSGTASVPVGPEWALAHLGAAAPELGLVAVGALVAIALGSCVAALDAVPWRTSARAKRPSLRGDAR